MCTQANKKVQKAEVHLSSYSMLFNWEKAVVAPARLKLFDKSLLLNFLNEKLR